MRADEQVVIASIFKILLVLEFARQVDGRSARPDRAGRWSPPRDRLGGWGTAGCADDAELSLRDLAYFAMSVTDNTAADLLLRRVGPDLLPLLAAELGLTRTRVLGGPRRAARVDARRRRAPGPRPSSPGSSRRCRAERVRALRVFDPARTTSSTAREITRLLTLIWRDEAGPAAACAMVRA